MTDKKRPRLVLYNDNDAPIAIFYVDSVYVPVDSGSEITVNFKEDTTKAIRKGRVNVTLLHMPNQVHRVTFEFHPKVDFIRKGDEITISQVTLPL